jgi:AsmA protein
MKPPTIKRPIKVAGLVVLALLVIGVLLGFLVNANNFRPVLESQLRQALGRQVRLGDMSFSPFTGNLVAKDVSIADDPAFSTQPFLQAKSLKIGVEMVPLIFHKDLKVTQFAAQQPDIHLIRGTNGTWNFSSIGKQAASRTGAQEKESALPGLTVGKIAVDDGRATVTDLPATGPPLVYDHLNLTASQFAFAKRFAFALAADLPAGGSLKASGQAGPVNAADAADTPLDANITVKHFDPVAAGVVKQGEGFSMLGDITAHVVSDGRLLAATGTVHAEKLQLVRNGAPTPKPVEVDFEISENLQTRAGEVRRIAIKTGNVVALIGGTFQQTGNQTNLNLRLTAKGLPVDQLESILPALGVRPPSGSTLRGGTLTTDLIIRGPANAPVIAGPVEVDNTRLAGFNLGSKLGPLAGLGGARTGDTTEVQTLRLVLQSSPAGVRTDNVYALLPALGTITGNGTVSDAGALNYRLLIKLNTTSGAGGMAAGLLSAFGGKAGSVTQSAVANGIPLTITGTTTNPVFTPDVQGIGGNLLQGQSAGQKKGTSAQDAVTALDGLLGPKH